MGTRSGAQLPLQKFLVLVFLALALKKYAETEIEVFLTATGFEPTTKWLLV